MEPVYSPHLDTTGDYEEALRAMVAQEGEEGMGITSPAVLAVSVPWLKKLCPELENGTDPPPVRFPTPWRDALAQSRSLPHPKSSNLATSRPSPPPNSSLHCIYSDPGPHQQLPDTHAAPHDLDDPFDPSLRRHNEHRWVKKLAVTHHVGNYVATARGPNPPKIFESMPIYVRLGMHLLYVGKEQEKLLGTTKVNELLREQSIRQGEAYDSIINPLSHIQSFVKTYKIDCSELLHPNMADYRCFNDFFYRKLRPGARPIDEPTNQSVISSAADCRLTVYTSVDKAKEFWIKGRNFTVANLLKDASLAAGFEGGELAIFRLAPADYHRYHSPIDAIVGPTKRIDGKYYTVNPSAINEPLDVFTKNRRNVTLLSMPAAGSTPVDVAFVSIGAMLVGSITETVKQGDFVRRGEEVGYFAYGGSTIIVLFPPGRVQWDLDLVNNSQVPLETAVRVGERIGVFV